MAYSSTVDADDAAMHGVLTTAVCPPCSGPDQGNPTCTASASLSALPEYVNWHSATFAYSAAPYQDPSTLGNAPECVHDPSKMTRLLYPSDVAPSSVLSCNTVVQRLSRQLSTLTTAGAQTLVDSNVLAAPDTTSGAHPFCEWIRHMVGGSAPLLWEDTAGSSSGVESLVETEGVNYSWLPMHCERTAASTEPLLSQLNGHAHVSLHGFGFAKSAALGALISDSDIFAEAAFTSLQEIQVSVATPDLTPLTAHVSNVQGWTSDFCDDGTSSSAIDVWAGDNSLSGNALNELETALFCDGTVARSSVLWDVCKASQTTSVSAWVMLASSSGTDVEPRDRPRVIFRVAQDTCQDAGQLLAVTLVPASGTVQLYAAGMAKVALREDGSRINMAENNWYFVEVAVADGVAVLYIDFHAAASVSLEDTTAAGSLHLDVCGSLCSAASSSRSESVTSTFQGYISHLRQSSRVLSLSGDIFHPYTEDNGTDICVTGRCIQQHGKCSTDGSVAFAPCCAADDSCIQTQDGGMWQCLPSARATGQVLLHQRCDSQVCTLQLAQVAAPVVPHPQVRLVRCRLPVSRFVALPSATCQTQLLWQSLTSAPEMARLRQVTVVVDWCA